MIFALSAFVAAVAWLALASLSAFLLNLVLEAPSPWYAVVIAVLLAGVMIVYLAALWRALWT